MALMRSTSVRLIVGGIVAVSALAFALGTMVPARLSTEIIIPSYPFRYDSIASLSKDADLVVEASVVAVTSEGEDAITPEMAATRLRLEVESVLAGAPVASVVVKQAGGRLRNTQQIVEGDPVMEVGDHYVLFLKLVVGGPYDGDYFVLGGPSGRFRVAPDDSVTSLGTVGIPSGYDIQRLSADLVVR